MLPPLFSLAFARDEVFLSLAACRAAASPLTGPASPPLPVGMGGGGGGGIPPPIIGGAAGGAGGAAGGLAGGSGGAAGGAEREDHGLLSLS